MTEPRSIVIARITPPCPVTKGPHVLTNPPWGASCRHCHKTWVGDRMTPTWPDNMDGPR